MNINVMVAEECHTRYAEEICQEIYISSRERKTGIAKRTPEYINEKILAGKAVIALSDEGDFAGFSYIESWGGKSFVANSGLGSYHNKLSFDAFSHRRSVLKTGNWADTPFRYMPYSWFKLAKRFL